MSQTRDGIIWSLLLLLWIIIRILSLKLLLHYLLKTLLLHWLQIILQQSIDRWFTSYLTSQLFLWLQIRKIQITNHTIINRFLMDQIMLYSIVESICLNSHFIPKNFLNKWAKNWYMRFTVLPCLVESLLNHIIHSLNN